jgi:hypothetical protein
MPPLTKHNKFTKQTHVHCSIDFTQNHGKYSLAVFNAQVNNPNIICEFENELMCDDGDNQ